MVSSTYGSSDIKRCQSEVARGHVNITRPTWCVQYEKKVRQTDMVRECKLPIITLHTRLTPFDCSSIHEFAIKG